jgi:hypothetical protein
MIARMPRPFPVMPRGPRRRRPTGPRRRLFACPRVAPDWELGALQALMQPQARGAILHREARQAWPDAAADAVEAAATVVRERLAHLGYDPRPHLPDDGDYHLVLAVEEHDAPAALAFAVVLSARLPNLWFVFDRLYLKAGKFYRRERGRKLNLVPARDVHLPRDIRAAIRMR